MMTTYCLLSDIDDTAHPCPEQCVDCLAASAPMQPFWAKRSAYPSGVPGILHLIGDELDHYSACGAQPGQHESPAWRRSDIGSKCPACLAIEGPPPDVTEVT